MGVGVVVGGVVEVVFVMVGGLAGSTLVAFAALVRSVVVGGVRVVVGGMGVVVGGVVEVVVGRVVMGVVVDEVVVVSVVETHPSRSSQQ